MSLPFSDSFSDFYVEKISQQLYDRLPRSVQIDDLFQWGAIGLAEAVEKFDPSRGIRFNTFAAFRIRGSMLDGLRSTAGRKRVMLTRIKKLYQTEQSLCRDLERKPTPEETADRLGISSAEYAEWSEHRQYNDLSTERVLFTKQDGMSGTIVDRSTDDHETDARLRIVTDAIPQLRPADQDIIRRILDREPEPDIELHPRSIIKRKHVAMKRLRAVISQQADLHPAA
jgi:RNA polymerase sigma factor FliA